MTRTRKDIAVIGRTVDEVRTTIQRWFAENHFKVMENNPTLIKGQWGHDGIAASKYLQAHFKPFDGGVSTQIEGWMTPFSVGEQEFSVNRWYTFGGIPKMEGWIAIRLLEDTLNAFSKPSLFCSSCGEGISSEKTIFCPRCGKPLCK